MSLLHWLHIYGTTGTGHLYTDPMFARPISACSLGHIYIFRIYLVKDILHNQITEFVSLGTVLADSLITLVYCQRLVSLSCFALIVLLN